jgi:hypothetical protein
MDKKPDSPITDSLESDILLLSSWLHGQEAHQSLPESGDKDDPALSTLTALSTILTNGNDAAPMAENVHAVIGSLEQDTVKCLVFAENTSPTGESEKTPKVQVIRHTSNTFTVSNGKNLLDNWADER